MRVLVATDSSDASEVAVHEGVLMTASPDDVLGVVHVLPALPRSGPFFPARDELLLAQAIEVAERAGAKARENIARVAPARADVIIDDGIADATIVKRAETFRADVIVVGSHGQSGHSRVLGSVAENVVRYAHCSVLVSRPCATRGWVLAATDLSDASCMAISAAADQARRRGATLKVMHATGFVEHELSYLMQIAPSLQTTDPERDTLPKALRDFISNLGVEATADIIYGHAAPAIVRDAETIGAELIVLGTHGMTGLARLALGSVAEKVVRAAPCSVMVVRRHQ